MRDLILTILAILMCVLVASIANAQRDQMKMGEAFGTQVIKKGQMKTKAAEKKPEPMKTQEALEIDVQRKPK